MKKCFLSIVVFFAIITPLKANNPTTVVDNYYLTQVNKFLRRIDNPGLNIEDSTKIERGHLFCSDLSSGLNYQNIKNNISKAVAGEPKKLQKNFIDYTTSIHMAAINSYCPEHYQQVLGK